MEVALREEAYGLKGAIHEILAKVRILKNRLHLMDEEEFAIAEESVERMHDELTKYSLRIDEIYLELGDDVSDIYRMDDEEEDWASGSEEDSDS